MNIKDLSDKILIINFGSQFTQLIARRIREFNIYCEIRSSSITIAEILDFNPKGIILSGGPASVIQVNAPTIDLQIFELGIPILGICYGQQLICQLLGGKVEQSIKREFGRAFINIKQNSKLITNLWQINNTYQVWMSHSDKVIALPTAFKVIASTDDTPFAIIEDSVRKIYGVQFHPEVSHTIGGNLLIKNFVEVIANCQNSWSMDSFIEEKVKQISTITKEDQVICAVSGGVDSSVVAALLNLAIPKQLTCIFVNTGLLRKNEANQVQDIFAELNIPLTYIDASKEFINKLMGVEDPEEKRKIIGNLFIDTFQQAASKIKNAKFLAQGTLYSDVVESASFDHNNSVIKSHHNVGGLPASLHLKLIEPLRELFKDEVRIVGRKLKINDLIIDRHPFPGPGLAIRIPGAITTEKIKLLQEADAIFIEELKTHQLYNKIWQAFVVLLPVKTVGVMGDSRTHEYACALRAVTSIDGMTADFFEFSHSFLSQVSNRIINSVKGINRVVYDITSKPPGTIEWE